MEVFSVACGVAAAYTVHRSLRYLGTIPGELRSLSDECSRLETIFRGIRTIEEEPQHQGLASSSILDRSVIVPIVDAALVDAHTRLSELQSFIKYISEKAQEDDKGDHWQWIRKKNNIDRLRAELRSIRYDLAVRCSNASPAFSNEELSMVHHTGQRAIQSMPQQGATFGRHCAKTVDRYASHEVWDQLYKEYQQSEWMSAYDQRPRAEAIQAPDHSESETSPIAQESISFWPGLFAFTCIGRYLPSFLAIKLLPRRLGSSIRTCYVLVALGMLSIAGSLALALWRTIKNSDIQGGFSLAQYILAVGALIIGCVLVLHSRTCSCWSSPSSTAGNGTPPEARPIELQQTECSKSSACPTAEVSA